MSISNSSNVRSCNVKNNHYQPSVLFHMTIDHIGIYCDQYA